LFKHEVEEVEKVFHHSKLFGHITGSGFSLLAKTPRSFNSPARQVWRTRMPSAVFSPGGTK
jgi:hypothetical protein